MENNDGREKMILPFSAIPNILIRERYLSQTEKQVLAYIISMGTTGLTMSVKTLRERLAPMGNTGLLMAIKRLHFLGMISIEILPRKTNEPKYKKPCHRYFFVKDPTEWIYTVDFRKKVALEAERLDPKVRLNFKSLPHLDDKALNEAFNQWLKSTKAIAFHQKPQTSAVAPSTDSLKWMGKIQKLKNGDLNFLKIADEANYYADNLTSQTDDKTECREKMIYINLIFDEYKKIIEVPPDEQTEKDLKWIASLEQQGLNGLEIASQIAKENNRRKQESKNDFKP